MVASARARGFTLIELVVAVAIVAALLAAAAPSFQTMINTSRLADPATELVGAVQSARAEALRRNSRAIVCRSTDSSTCAAGSATWTGWIMFADSNANGQRDGAEEVVKSGAFASPVLVKPSSNIAALNDRITFGADGYARASDGVTLLAGTLSVCIPTTQPPQNIREVNVASGGRTTTRSKNGSGGCATPGNT